MRRQMTVADRPLRNLSARIDHRLGPIFNITAPPYNGKGDNSTDNATALSNTIQAADAAGGGLVYLPGGQYLFDSDVSETITSPITIGGAGNITTRLDPSGSHPTGALSITLINNTGALTGGGLANMQLKGQLVLDTDTNSKVWYQPLIENVTFNGVIDKQLKVETLAYFTVVRNCRFIGAIGALNYHLWIEANGTLVDHCDFSPRSGFGLWQAAGAVTIKKCYFESPVGTTGNGHIRGTGTSTRVIDCDINTTRPSGGEHLVRCQGGRWMFLGCKFGGTSGKRSLWVDGAELVKVADCEFVLIPGSSGSAIHCTSSDRPTLIQDTYFLEDGPGSNGSDGWITGDAEFRVMGCECHASTAPDTLYFVNGSGCIEYAHNSVTQYTPFGPLATGIERFAGDGVHNYGYARETVDGSGNFDIAHGLDLVPISIVGDTHDGGDGSASFSDASANFVNEGVRVGDLCKNITDGSEGTITVRTATTLTVTLAGGTDNDFDDGDVIEIYRFPRAVQLTIHGDHVFHADAQSVDTTNIQVRIKDSSGADRTTGDFSVSWDARHAVVT